MRAAERLWSKRSVDLPAPKTPEEFMDLIDSMAARCRAHGCYLSARDKRALRIWHDHVRAVMREGKDI